MTAEAEASRRKEETSDGRKAVDNSLKAKACEADCTYKACCPMVEILQLRFREAWSGIAEAIRRLHDSTPDWSSTRGVVVLSFSFYVVLRLIEAFYHNVVLTTLSWAGLLAACVTYPATFFDGAEYNPDRPELKKKGRTGTGARDEEENWEDLQGWGEDSTFIKKVYQYFDLKVVVADKERIRNCKQVILCVHPHGVLSMAHFVTIAGAGDIAYASNPRRRRALAASVLFRIPGIREIALSWGLIDAGRKTATMALKQGFSLSIVPGGLQEMFESQPGVQRTNVAKRFGFVKLAMEHGVPLVPIYAFGETDLYCNPSWLTPFRQWVVDTFGAVISFAYDWHSVRLPVEVAGRKEVMVPLPFLPAVGRRLTVVVGNPVMVEKVEAPTKEQVAAVHAKYIAGLKETFDDHKAKFGYADAELEVN